MTIRKLDLFPSSGEKTSTQLGPLERANLNYCVSEHHIKLPYILQINLNYIRGANSADKISRKME
jgi:hypothetical protein